CTVTGVDGTWTGTTMRFPFGTTACLTASILSTTGTPSGLILTVPTRIVARPGGPEPLNAVRERSTLTVPGPPPGEDVELMGVVAQPSANTFCFSSSRCHGVGVR